MDYSRILSVLKQIDFSKIKKNYKQDLEDIEYRVGNNIPKKHIELVRIDKIGAKRAEKLYEAGFKTKQDIINNIEAASKIAKLNLKKYIT
jgi:replicative superfamily II helicase